MPFPKIPTLDARGVEEGPREFGLRAFRFLLTERLVAGVLNTDALEHALAVSQLIVIAHEMADTVRDEIHAVRLDIMTTIGRRQREQREAAALAASRRPIPKTPGQPTRLRCPVPIKPTPSAVTNPF
jgi:hypothetical protein